ncbi:MAG TPA: hypothetical protein VGL59_17790 [Polyangia bacterium]|jgi:hypothetical protein
MKKDHLLLWAAGAIAVCGCQQADGPVMFTGGITASQQADGGSGGAAGGSGSSAAPDASTAGPDVVTSMPASPAPPATWQEHWFEHNQLLKLVMVNDDVALYFDNDMDVGDVSWISPFLSALWHYTKQTYGQPGDPRLFAVFHSGRYDGGHAASIFDPTHDYRNVIDMGGAAGLWNTPNGDQPTFTAGLLIELASLGIEKVPSVALTSNKFNSIYAYDALKAIGMNDAAEAWLPGMNADVADFPRAGTYWFRDWYFPLWRDHGGAAVFSRYLSLLAQHYSKIPRLDGRGQTYAPAMNWGEYIHFMSGATGTDLKPLATQAFGWPDAREAEYQQAKTDFPAIKY